MDVLVIHDDRGCRVRLAKALHAAAHRVTLSSSIDEAGEILQFAESAVEAPTVILVADQLLGRDSARLHANLTSRFGHIHWVPLRRDVVATQVADWLTSLDRGIDTRLDPSVEPVAFASNVVFIDPERRRRHALARLRFSHLRGLQRTLSEPVTSMRVEPARLPETDELIAEAPLAS